MCQADIADFLTDVAYKFEELSGPNRFKNEKVFDIIVPSCIDKVYILDDTKDLTKSKESLPIEINDQYDSGTKNNLIIYKNNKLEKAINTRQITNSKLSFANIDFPHYLCFDANKKKKIQIQEVGFGDRIYFTDSGKRQELLDPKSLNDKTLLKDVVESGTANVFIMEGGKILLSFNLLYVLLTAGVLVFGGYKAVIFVTILTILKLELSFSSHSMDFSLEA